ncbi:MAG: hypothetical protein JW770_05355, partial [Actinobacteria bacterium]|nr:hypothetical protein [Actinomycetota bacterium]
QMLPYTGPAHFYVQGSRAWLTSLFVFEIKFLKAYAHNIFHFKLCLPLSALYLHLQVYTGNIFDRINLLIIFLEQ